MVWNVQSSLPLRASKPRTSSFTCVFEFGRAPTPPAGPTITTSPTTIAGDDEPASTLSVGPRNPRRRSTTPASPNSRFGSPVLASSDQRKKPGVTTNTRLSSPPPLQNATPRPDVLRGPARKRSPSFGRQTQSVSPDFASSATTLRVAPAVAYSTPPTISGVVSLFSSGFGPKLPADHRHATLRSFTLRALI